MKVNWQDVLTKLSQKPSNEAELDVLKYWEENDTLRKSIDNRPEDNPFTFYDGPITANNKPHYGHALTMVLKDVFPRYWTMRGYRIDRSLGWDCQGIPVEYEVEKKLEFTNKGDIEAYGIEKFNQLCRESVETYQAEIFELTKRMGRWVNSDEEYATMDPQYIESLFWSLKELHNKDLLYKGYKVVPYSTRAGTTLSNSEVALGGYKEIVDTAITVKFKLRDQDRYVLAWTTTPWTMPGNLLLAVLDSEDYVVVKHEGQELVAGKKLAEGLFGEDYEVVEELKGKDLVGLEYEPLYPYYSDRAEQGAFKIVHGDHVTMEEGTGVVHQAPYGEDDFFLLTGMGIELFDYLDDTGAFTDDVELVAGKFYKGGNKVIVQDLVDRGLMFHHEDYPHRMPMCWRTNTPLIYKPVRSWYVAVTKIVDDMVKENDEINWIPDHIKKGRFGNWLENARDWALSRKRYWGTPLPVWECDKCDHVDVLGSFAEIKEKSGVELTDPHKPFIDEVKYKCDCGGEMTRVEDVIDVWYDSGAMPFARFHYPFENKELFESKYPAQYIAEGIDQTRGWFYTLHVLGVALFGKKSFENCVVNGMALASDGSKMAKSQQNFTPIDEVLEQFGADPMRLYFLGSPIVRGEDTLFDEKYIKEANSAVLFPLWNSLKYFLNYAQKHDWDNRSDDMPKVDHVMDKWVLTRLKETAFEMNKLLEKYEVQKATLVGNKFIDELSRWYIRGSRDRFVNGDEGAMSTLYYVLLNLSKLLAPIIPMMTERMYWALTEGLDVLDSVHLTDYPQLGELSEEEKGELSVMENLRKVVNLGQSVRVENGLKVRQPLSAMEVKGAKFDEGLTEMLVGELNVKEVKYVDKLSKWKVSAEGTVQIALDDKLTEELKAEGTYREVVRAIQSYRKTKGLKVGDEINLEVFSTNKELLDIFDREMDRLLIDVMAQFKVGMASLTTQGAGPEVVKINGEELEIKLV